jgi:DNA (cytosine-5)-methyltransferase 1
MAREGGDVTLTVGSLFSGIGGLDLGLERAGMTVKWQSEIHPYACRVLAKHWPTVPNLGDITKIDWSEVERVDVICGGYPCQPFSLAGIRLGKDDPRHLWPHVATAIRNLRPRYALLENVAGHLSLGFGRVLGDLAESGYDATWDCIPAAAVGAPHRRDRVFIVAHANSDELRVEPVDFRWLGGALVIGDDGPPRDVAHSNGERLERSESQWEQQCFGEWTGDAGSEMAYAAELHGYGGNDHSSSSSSSARTRQALLEPRDRDSDTGADGGWWSSEPDVGRVAHGVPSRVDRLYGLGNAVVPQVAEYVGRRLMEVVTP